MAEAARNVVCSGGRPLAITDGLNFGNPEKQEIFWQLEQAVSGMAEACNFLKLPVTGGNVSLYNETEGEASLTAIYPTPVVGVVGLIEQNDHTTTQFFQNPGDVYSCWETQKTKWEEVLFSKCKWGKFPECLRNLIWKKSELYSKHCWR